MPTLGICIADSKQTISRTPIDISGTNMDEEDVDGIAPLSPTGSMLKTRPSRLDRLGERMGLLTFHLGSLQLPEERLTAAIDALGQFASSMRSTADDSKSWVQSQEFETFFRDSVVGVIADIAEAYNTYSFTGQDMFTDLRNRVEVEDCSERKVARLERERASKRRATAQQGELQRKASIYNWAGSGNDMKSHEKETAWKLLAGLRNVCEGISTLSENLSTQYGAGLDTFSLFRPPVDFEVCSSSDSFPMCGSQRTSIEHNLERRFPPVQGLEVNHTAPGIVPDANGDPEFSDGSSDFHLFHPPRATVRTLAQSPRSASACSSRYSSQHSGDVWGN